MPELPEVESLRGYLEAQCSGAEITRAELSAFSALKTFSPPLDELRGRRVADVRRKGKYLALRTSGEGDEHLCLVMHLARGGWIRWYDTLKTDRAKPGKGPLALRMGFDSGAGFDVTEAGTEKRLALWVVRRMEEVDQVAGLGPDPLEEGMDAGRLAELLRSGPGRIKQVLTDQRVLAGVGNAYSDEALHMARLSPYKGADKLTDDEALRLAEAVRDVLSHAVERSAELPAAGLKSEKKSGMRVHGRTGQPCPVCGDTVREVAFASKSWQYCPTCQTGGKPLADRRMSRLLK